jgi:adenine phosphoribosyltransferase
MTADARVERIRATLRDVPDFPKPGIVFKDIHPLLQDPACFRLTLDVLAERAREFAPQRIVGIESRGFLFGAPLADRLGVGLSLVRKPGKLPYRTLSESYSLEYGTDTIQMHVDAVTAGERVLIVDDLLATGGTARAAANLVTRLGGQVVGCLFVVELGFLSGRAKLDGVPASSLVLVA